MQHYQSLDRLGSVFSWMAGSSPAMTENRKLDDMERPPKVNADNFFRKTGKQVKLCPWTIPRFRIALTTCSRSGGADAADKRLTKNLRSFVPRKPIDKSRFGRENPRNSKEIQPPESGFSKLNSHRPRKPKRSSGLTSRGRRREGAKPTIRRQSALGSPLLPRPESRPHHQAAQRPDGGQRGQAGAACEVDRRKGSEQ
jgi:hypothetical protein